MWTHSKWWSVCRLPFSINVKKNNGKSNNNNRCLSVQVKSSKNDKKSYFDFKQKFLPVQFQLVWSGFFVCSYLSSHSPSNTVKISRRKYCVSFQFPFWLFFFLSLICCATWAFTRLILIPGTVQLLLPSSHHSNLANQQRLNKPNQVRLTEPEAIPTWDLSFHSSVDMYSIGIGCMPHLPKLYYCSVLYHIEKSCSCFTSLSSREK